MKRYICTECKNVCHNDSYPEIVFSQFKPESEDIIICENCSIDYEQNKDGNIVKRDLTD